MVGYLGNSLEASEFDGPFFRLMAAERQVVSNLLWHNIDGANLATIWTTNTSPPHQIAKIEMIRRFWVKIGGTQRPIRSQMRFPTNVQTRRWSCRRKWGGKSSQPSPTQFKILGPLTPWNQIVSFVTLQTLKLVSNGHESNIKYTVTPNKYRVSPPLRFWSFFFIL